MTELRKNFITDELTGTTAKVNDDGQLHVVLEGKVVDGNSSNTPLGAGGTFTGVAVDTLEFAIILVSVYSDVGSAVDGLQVEFSSDGVNWYHQDTFTIPAATGKTFSFQTVAKWLRVVYTNGAGAQSVFDLQTIGKKTYSKPSSHRLADSISDQDDAELVKSVLTAEDFLTNLFKNIQSGTLSDTAQNIDGAYGLITIAQLMGRVSDTLVAPAYLDAVTQELVALTHEHHEIHAEEHYFVTDAVDLALNNVRDFQITTPNNTKWSHLSFQISVEDETDIIVYEGASIVTPGTAITPPNNNRNSSNTSNLTFAYIDNTSVANANADTPVAGATQIARVVLGSGAFGGANERKREKEIVLKQNTIYCIRIIANAAGWSNYDFEWYEHTNKN